MSSNKLTERQQIKKWIVESNSIDYSESVLEEIFSIAMNYKKDNPNLSLKQLYSYAFIMYINKKYEKCTSALNK